jgi:hypothetical protein
VHVYDFVGTAPLAEQATQRLFSTPECLLLAERHTLCLAMMGGGALHHSKILDRGRGIAGLS